MIVLIVVVGFLVLTPFFLMILNSFQTARPGQPIVWGVEGWVKAFSTPGYRQSDDQYVYPGDHPPSDRAR